MIESKKSSLDYIDIDTLINSHSKELIKSTQISHLFDGEIIVNDLKIPRIKTKLFYSDIFKAFLIRIGINRNNYKIPSGLYAVGNPNENSPIFVSCNYKLSFDHLRKNLNDVNCFILILDTKGINVWCSSAKGTFGTEELIYQIKINNLENNLKTKHLILPQLGATSMVPHLINKYTAYNIEYGPIKSSDIKSYLTTNTCTEKMRTINFGLIQRIVLSPIEFFMYLKYSPIVFIFYYIMNLIIKTQHPFISSLNILSMYIITLLFSTIIFAITLPLLPTKLFSIKGLLLILPFALFSFYNYDLFYLHDSLLFRISLAIQLCCIASYITFNFTGSTTFTSFSGVKHEAKVIIRPLKLIFILATLLLSSYLIN